MNHIIGLILVLLVGPLFGYLSGSILWSVVLGKKIYKKDIREYASKNAGATNTSRVFGKKFGAIILVLDVLKSYLPTMILWLILTYAFPEPALHKNHLLNEYVLVYLTSISAILGHCYPVWFKFKGGKGVSCFGGMIIAINPFLAISATLIFIAIIKWKKYVSLGSIVGAISTFVLMFIPGLNWMYMSNDSLMVPNLINGYNVYSVLIVALICFFGAIIVIAKHHENISRLVSGTERKIGSSKEAQTNHL